MENQQNNGQGFAIASLIIGIFAFLLSIIPCINFVGIVIGAVAIIFGIVSLSRANETKQSRGMAIAGITLGGVAIFLAIFMWTFIISSKSVVKDKVMHFFEWAEDIEQYDNDNDIEFDNQESLDNLEKALDELEGSVDEVNDQVNDAVKDVHKDVQQAIDDAKDQINEAKEQQK